MSRCRALVVLLSLALLAPSSAFAQGAGDEQYQDPFGDEQTQPERPRAAQDDGLTDEPPGGGDNGGGNTQEPAPAPEQPAPQPEDDSALPNTGSDPRILAFVGVLFLLAGVGLRLRTIDPDAY